MRNACVSESMTKSVLLRWAPSLNDRSKLTGQCKDVKSGCTTSVGHYHSHILSLNKFSCYCPCTCKQTPGTETKIELLTDNFCSV